MIPIVIPNLHSPLIDEVVAALERQTAREQIGQIIVVGQDRYGKIPPAAQAITTSAPVSAAAARNIGARQARGQYVLFLDADCVAAPDLIERLLARHADGHAVLGGAMSLRAENYWVLCDNLLSFGDVLATAPAGARPYLPSFCLSVQRAAFEAAGGFDEGYPGAAGEDIELCLRLRQLGHDCWFEPAAVVTHRPPRASARAMWRHQRAFGRGYYQVVRQLPKLLPSPLLRLPPIAAPLLAAAAPLLTCADLARLLTSSPALRARPFAAPGLALGRIGWYVGVASACLTSRQPLSPCQKSAGLPHQ
ncbi:hypothetical protein SE17_22960 [Kouleothrix aurantiaca]|uniref:Glycosyltransferase 2-like domain-containing protein n=1 Tax=Kouleothrix aurantiaca TaxID=186479 RepID=A0A0N8PRX4_9CHLR|nr:hypothetical protein SE17_22960 [Kouleothrix aurantiaca]